MSMKRDPKGSNTTLDFSVDYVAYAHYTADKYTSNDTTMEDEDSNEQVVFLCGSCRLPVGDSQSWAGSDEEQNQIILKRVSDNVLVGKEPRIAGTTKDLGCLVVLLTCSGCSSQLGINYISTPRKLDHIRSLFCLDVAAIDSYVLGSSEQQVAAVSPKQQPITLDYRQAVEGRLAEIKALTLSMRKRLLELEADLHAKRPV